MGEPRKISADDGPGQGPGEAWSRFQDIRGRTMALAAPLTAEDQCVQSMADASPTKWHLAHTTWFFETFILKPFQDGYEEFHPRYNYLFNSYYKQVGAHHERARRGLLSRPALDDVHAYRRHVEDGMERLVAGAGAAAWAEIAFIFELGLNHEQQHQELLLTDIKHVFSCNPLKPAYAPLKPPGSAATGALEWIEFAEGLVELGHAGGGFAFDNEGPRHKAWLDAFRIASSPVTNAEYLEFIGDGGYRRPELWLSDGWAAVEREGWKAPLYWENAGGAREGTWRAFTLSGMRPLDARDPVCHVSYFEADAFAKWAGKRLPREGEWEMLASGLPVEGNFADSGRYHPAHQEAVPDHAGQVFGDVWEWTGSAYAPYPGYRAAEGAVGEYNGKFMCGQIVLRGGSAATPPGHLRPTYRNFFYPPDRWQFSGLRLAEDA